MTNQQLSAVEINPPQKPTASVIWLHGLGADGHDFVPLVPQLNLPESLPIRFIFPHAPIIPITINGGYPMRAWYDILGLEEGSREDEAGVRAAAKQVDALIQQEQARGMPAERIVLAGFSQGGAMALHCGLRFPERLGGILALSTYLPVGHTVANEVNPVNQSIPIFLAHGTDDTLLPLSWAQMSNEFLQKLGYSIELRTYPMAHSVCGEEIKDIGDWFKKVLMGK
jgi:phospholipase/carboxylesterase